MSKRSRTSRTIVGLLVVIVVLLVRGTRRQRRLMAQLGMPRRRPLRAWWDTHAALWHAVTQLGFRWPWDGVVDAVSSFFGDAFDTLKGWLQAVVDAMADTVFRAIDAVWTQALHALDIAHSLFDAVKQFAIDQLNNALSFVYNLIDGLRDALSNVYSGLVGFVGQIASEIRSWVADLVNAVYGTVSSWVNDVRSFAATIVGAVYGYVNDAVHSVAGQLLGLLDNVRGWVADLVRTIYGYVDDAAHTIAAALLTGLDAVRGWVADLVRSALGLARDWIDFVNDELRKFFDIGIRPVNDYLFGTVQAIVDAVTDVIDWLIWLAKFPFVEAVDAWNTLFGTSAADLLDHIARTHAARGAAAAQQIARRVS